MVRAPCCEKIGLKKGPWTPEEDEILISYIQQYGHANWRALPKQAGLLRCGKSCRLRWTNYLRPDIKRGNFTREEEDTIIKLHEMLGNRWSAIAARLPGRTDNEIKNVWHTHLKKRLKQNNLIPSAAIQNNQELTKTGSGLVDLSNPDASAGNECGRTKSPQQCSSSDISSFTIYDDHSNVMSMKIETSNELPEMDEDFWSEVLSSDNSSSESDFSVSSLGSNRIEPVVQYEYCNSSMYEYDSVDFWYDLITKAEESFELPEI